MAGNCPDLAVVLVIDSKKGGRREYFAQDLEIMQSLSGSLFFIIFPPPWYSGTAFHKIIFIKYVSPYLISNIYQSIELLILKLSMQISPLWPDKVES